MVYRLQGKSVFFSNTWVACRDLKEVKGRVYVSIISFQSKIITKRWDGNRLWKDDIWLL